MKSERQKVESEIMNGPEPKNLKEAVDNAKRLVDVINKETGEVSQSEPITPYSFSGLEYSMKKGEWFLSMTLDAFIPKLFMNYLMRWVVDLSVIEDAFRVLNNDRADYRDSLLEDEDRRVRINFDRRESEINKSKLEMINAFGEVEFEVAVEKMARKESGTAITFKIPSDIIDLLNKHRADEEHYKVCLIKTE